MTLHTRYDRKVTLHLTGGLGNQLFQLAAALNLNDYLPFSIEWILGRPRLNQKRLPQIDCYELPSEIRLMHKTRDTLIARKVLGYLLRSGIAPRGMELFTTYKKISTFLGSFIISLHFREFKWISASNRLGYSDIKLSKRSHLVGYFQSFRYTEDVRVIEIMRRLHARDFSSYQSYVALSLVEKPLVVHVRLADYFNESTFGILSKEYYSESITKHWDSESYRKIWLFSDEPEKAIDWIPDKFRKSVRIFGDVEGCVVKTLEVMRLGHGYVIANSSFSWWGARLSHNLTAIVTAPTPWFKAQTEPEYLIPPNWFRNPGWPTEV